MSLLFQSFRDIKALKVVASHTMTGSLRGTGSKKQPPTVGTQFQASFLVFLLLVSLQINISALLTNS